LKELLLPQSQLETEVHIDDPLASTRLSLQIEKRLRELYQNHYDSLAVVCIGTDRSTGDALGPLVGTYLMKSYNNRFEVYGNLENPVHAMNLKEITETIYTKHNHPFIIAIDACLGKVSNIGKVRIQDGPVRPGAGVNKDLAPIGDANITGIVNVGGFMEYLVLQNTRLHLVTKMAEVISFGLRWGVNSFIE